MSELKLFDREKALAELKKDKSALLAYDLSEAELREADLRGASLSWANLSGADLREANLREADLSWANLRRANLRRANLREADLSWANLSGADLSGANLSWANLREADLRGAELDFSAWPLWCGGQHVKTDKRIMCQLAYHFCAQDCDDPEYIAARNAILDFANQFHRVDECGRLEER